jgi:hypothetical protein
MEGTIGVSPNGKQPKGFLLLNTPPNPPKDVGFFWGDKLKQRASASGFQGSPAFSSLFEASRTPWRSKGKLYVS